MWQSPWPTLLNEHTGDHVDNLREIIGCDSFPELLAKFQEGLGNSYNSTRKKDLKILVRYATEEKHSVAIATILRHCLSNRELDSIKGHVRHLCRSYMQKKHLKECGACKNPSKQAGYKDLLGKASDIFQEVIFRL